MNAINRITSILKAMGANPETITENSGDTIIKVNAPPVPASDPAPLNFNDPWVAFFEPD